MRKFGPSPKADPWTTATPSALQQFRDEIFVAGDHFARGRLAPDRFGAGGIDIKRPFGRRAGQIFRLIEHGDDEVSPVFEDIAALGDGASDRPKRNSPARLHASRAAPRAALCRLRAPPASAARKDTSDRPASALGSHIPASASRGHCPPIWKRRGILQSRRCRPYGCRRLRAQVSQQPLRKKPVSGVCEHASRGKPRTLRDGRRPPPALSSLNMGNPRGDGRVFRAASANLPEQIRSGFAPQHPSGANVSMLRDCAKTVAGKTTQPPFRGSVFRLMQEGKAWTIGTLQPRCGPLATD